MVRRGFATLVAAFLVSLAMPSAAVSAPPRARIIAVGDLHGDYAVWLAIARAAGVIDGGGHWAGGQATLVQLGDIVDRGPNSLKIIHSLMQLQREAPKAHGRVIVLVGNHEAMQMTGDLRYVTAGEFAAFADAQSAARRDRVFAANQAAIAAEYRKVDPKLGDAAVRARWIGETPLGKVEHDAAWRADGELGRWTIGNPAVALIGGSLFVHGGLSQSYAALGLPEINRRVRAALAARDTNDAAIINDEFGPLWNRVYALSPPGAGQADAATAELANVLRQTGARRMVIAHTPILTGIAISRGGTLARVDTGNSAFYNGTPSFLEIRGDRLIPHVVARPAGDSQ